MFISFLYRYLLIGLFDHFEFQVFNLKKIFCSFTGIFIWHGCSKFRDKKMKSIISISSSQALCLSRVPSFCLSVCSYESIVFRLFLSFFSFLTRNSWNERKINESDNDETISLKRSDVLFWSSRSRRRHFVNKADVLHHENIIR